MEDLMERMGRRIRAARSAAQLTQESLAERADLHPSYVGQLERGHREPSLKAVKKVADALGLEFHTLFAPLDSDAAFSSEVSAIISDVPDEKRDGLVLALRQLAALIR